jgi:2,3-bisphosphoglycerate-independent phosphoglycerate mutase
VAFVAQLVSSDGTHLTDQTAGEVTTEEAHRLFEAIEENLEETWFRFYPGQRERQLLVWSHGPRDLQCVPPDEAEGRALEECMPQGDGAEVLRRLYWDSLGLLDDHPINRRRRDEGRPLANLVWPWAPGVPPRRPESRGRPTGSQVLLTGSHFARGVAWVGDARCPQVFGATGWWDTSLRAKLGASMTALASCEELFVHVRAPGLPHATRDVPRLVEFLERLDTELVAPLRRRLEDAEETSRLVVVGTTPVPAGEAEGLAAFVTQPGLPGGDWRADAFTGKAAAGAGLVIEQAAEWRNLLTR